MLPTPQLATNVDDVPAGLLAARPGLGTPTRDALALLYDRVLTVERLQLWLENAARSLPPETTGAHKAAENHRWLVRQLDAILVEYTGRHISRSKKMQRYVELCFEAAAPSVGFGSIEKAIEAFVNSIPRR